MRLGYGGGFYDRYLKQKENLHRTGIAFGEQIVKRIPTEIHDHPMDDVITGHDSPVHRPLFQVR